MTQSLPILIAGAGPVGLSLALALSRAGIPVEVFEMDAELNTQIRASTFHPKTLEMFKEWGVVDEIIQHGYKVDQLQYWERAPRRLIADFSYASITDDTPYPYRLQCPQHIATRVLKPAVEATSTGKVHMGHKLIDFTDYGTHVTARFETASGIVEREGAYIVGADGTHSTVRKQLNIGFKGKTYEDRLSLIHIFFNVARAIKLGYFAENVSRKFLLTHLPGMVDYHEDAIELVVKKIGGHPLLLQAAGSAIFLLVTKNEDKNLLEITDLKQIFNEMLDFFNHIFEFYFNTAEPAQRYIINRFAHQSLETGEINIEAIEELNAKNSIGNSLQSQLARLCELDLLKKGSRNDYQFVIPLFADYLRKKYQPYEEFED